MRQSRAHAAGVDAIVCDLLMAVMNSLDVWAVAASDTGRGLAWRDAVTVRMRVAEAYRPYEELVVESAAELGLAPDAPFMLFEAWMTMEPWPDASALDRQELPYAFATNCSSALAATAVDRSRMRPRFVLAAEDVGWFKPRPEVYQEACRRLGSIPERTLFVAGSPYDAEGAAAAGLPTWLVVRRPDHRDVAPGIASAPSFDEVIGSIA